MAKPLSFLAGFFLIAGLTACSSDPSLQFEHPQPVTMAAETAFPTALWGQYLNPQDSSTLHLTATLLLRKTRFLSPTAVQELKKDSIAYHLANGRFFTDDFPKGLPILRSTPDSLYLLVTSTDTLYIQDASHQLRQFKGQFFLNRQLDSKRWAVFCLKPKGKNQIELLYLDDSVDRDKMREISPLRQEKEVFLANPSKKELRKFLRQGGFRQRETYTRMSQR